MLVLMLVLMLDVMVMSEDGSASNKSTLLTHCNMKLLIGPMVDSTRYIILAGSRVHVYRPRHNE